MVHIYSVYIAKHIASNSNTCNIHTYVYLIFLLFFITENYNGVIISKPCRRYIGSPKYKFYITEDGTTVIQELGVWRKFSIEENYYCMEYVRMTKKHEILLCMTDTRLTPETGSKGTIMIISCVCLLLTLFVYFILPDLKNLIGNIVITYCSCLFVAFVLLIYLQFEPNPGELCDYVGKKNYT